MESSLNLCVANKGVVQPPQLLGGVDKVDNRDVFNSQNQIKIRILKDIFFKSSIIMLSFISLLPLFLILYYITKNGIAVINWEFLTELPRPIGEDGGGIFNAIAGTLMLIVLSSVLSIPFGISAGIYLSEKGEAKISQLVRLFLQEVLEQTTLKKTTMFHFWQEIQMLLSVLYLNQMEVFLLLELQSTMLKLLVL